MQSVYRGMWAAAAGKPECLNTFVIPDAGIKPCTDVAEPLMQAVIYRNTAAAVAVRQPALRAC